MLIESVYSNSFKEVYDILNNTDYELVEKIPDKFMRFIKDHMNTEYKTNIDKNEDIDKQELLLETQAILSLIFRNYWATDEEKQEFNIKDKQEFIQTQLKKKENCKDIYEIFEERKNTNSVNNNELNNNLVIVKKESVIKRFLNKVLNLFKK